MMSDMRMLLSGMAEAKQGRWTAGCVSGSFEGGVSGWLSCSSGRGGAVSDRVFRACSGLGLRGGRCPGWSCFCALARRTPPRPSRPTSPTAPSTTTSSTPQSHHQTPILFNSSHSKIDSHIDRIDRVWRCGC